jgi:hypothetical protein
VFTATFFARNEKRPSAATAGLTVSQEVVR